MEIETITIEDLARPELINRAGLAIALAEEIAPLAGAVAKELEAAYGARCRVIQVDTPEAYEGASLLLRELSELKANVEEKRRALKDPVFQGGKRIDAIFAEIQQPLIDADQALRRKVSDYLAEQTRLRREAERRAREEAEQLREQAALEAAEEAQAAGASTEEVDKVLDEAMTAPVAVALPDAAPQKTGVSGRKTWRAEVTDLRKFVEACLGGANGAGLFLLQVDGAKLNALAKTHDGQLAIAGVRVYEAHSVAVRR